MSYILDALRRAEADRERERGAVPGLHSPTLPGADAPTATASRRWLPWMGGGALLLAGAGVGLWWSGGAADRSTPPPAPAAPTVTAAPPAAPPAPASAPAPGPADAVARALPAPAVLPAATAASASPYLPPAPPSVTAVTAPPPAAPAPARPAPAAAPERLPLLSELPDATRRTLPRLNLGGSVYSDDARSRLVIINGDVLHEGAALGADLVLEQIRPRELVLNFKGLRYRQPL